MTGRAGHLAGVTVLDLASVGPAARASRILADYGAAVIKVGPTSQKGGVQIRPPYYSYGAGRGMQRVRIDLKAERGKAAFLKLAAMADVVIESFRPGVAARTGPRLRRSEPLEPPARVLLHERLRPRRTRKRSGPATTSIIWPLRVICTARAGVPTEDLHCRVQPSQTVPPAACRRSSRSWQRSCDERRRGEGAYLDVSVADGVLHLMSLAHRPLPRDG